MREIEINLKDRGAAVSGQGCVLSVVCLSEPWGFTCCIPRNYLFIHNCYVISQRAEEKNSVSFPMQRATTDRDHYYSRFHVLKQ